MKYSDDEKVCQTCAYLDDMSDSSWCMNPRGARYKDTHYHIADTGCDKWKPDESYLEMLREAEARSKPSYGNGYVSNVWDEWQKKAYQKGMIHE